MGKRSGVLRKTLAEQSSGQSGRRPQVAHLVGDGNANAGFVQEDKLGLKL
jgi:hypothetical protein